MDSSSCLIDGFGPLPVERPQTVAELGDLVRRAAESGQATYPFGGRTQLDLGNSPTKPGMAADLCGLDQVIDFPARDMTVTVQAGITIAKLQALLAPENLRLPIDVPQAERATLGGIIATNVSGPRRLGYGTLRDYVIGISAVNDEGNEFKAGGRVVKNVAGYDLCKLLVGSLGTLGIITQVTLKLRPLAEKSALVLVSCADADLAALLGQLHGSKTRPVCLELLNRPATRAACQYAGMTEADAPWTVFVGYEGSAATVGWQTDQVANELGGRFVITALLGSDPMAIWRAVTEQPGLRDAEVVQRVSLAPSVLAAACAAIQAAHPDAVIRSHAGNGIIDVGRAAGVSATVLSAPAAAIVTLRCPLAWKKALPVWGPPRGDAALMRAIKKRFDPRNLFNPGRFVDGI